MCSLYTTFKTNLSVVFVQFPSCTCLVNYLLQIREMRSTGKDDEKDEKENAERILFSDKSPCSKQVKKGHDMRRKAS